MSSVLDLCRSSEKDLFDLFKNGPWQDQGVPMGWLLTLANGFQAELIPNGKTPDGTLMYQPVARADHLGMRDYHEGSFILDQAKEFAWICLRGLLLQKMFVDSNLLPDK